jgi:hypothetical protein
MKLALQNLLLTVLMGFMLASPVFGQTTAAKVKKIPFHGKLQAVDTSADTITIAGKTPRVFHLTSATKITDGAGSPSTLSVAVVGEDVGGSYTKDNMTLYSVRFGAKSGEKTASTSSPAAASTAPPAPSPAPVAATPPPAPEPASAPAAAAPAAAAATTTAKAKKQTFTGKVVSVDTSSNTLVVHGKADQTFTVTSTTKFTGASDLSGITAGTKVSGSYSKSADGATLTVYTLKVVTK